MAYLIQSFMENKRKETLYERVKDALMFPENNKISNPFFCNKQGHKLFQTRDYFDFFSLMHFVDWNVNIQRRLVQNEPFVLATPDTPPGVSSLLSTTSPIVSAMMAPVTQRTPSDEAQLGQSHCLIPTVLVEEVNGDSDLDFAEIIRICDYFGFDTKISINSSEKLIDYEFSHKKDLQPSESKLRKNSIAMIGKNMDLHFYFLIIMISPL